MPPELLDVDHVHVHVRDRAAAESWYSRVLGLTRVPGFESWAVGDGPRMLGNPSGSIRLSLFQRPVAPSRSVIAFRVGGRTFLDWQRHLRSAGIDGVEPEDHGLSWSIYFADPDGNPFEITTYDHAQVAVGLAEPNSR